MKKILYAAGPGDIIQTYRYWIKGIDDPSQVALTYSKQFYEFCEETGISAVAVSSNSREEVLQDEQFILYNQPKPEWLTKGIMYHLGQLHTSFHLLKLAKKHKCNLAIVANYNDWFSLVILKLFGINIIPTLHCTFWTTGLKPNNLKNTIIRKLNSWFWQHCVSATLCISPECEKQLREICPNLKSPIFQARPTYLKEAFTDIQPPSHNPEQFNILFAGRLEENKGVLELYETAQILEKSHPGVFKWHICGTGTLQGGLEQLINDDQSNDYFMLKGHLNREQMLAYFSLSHIFIIPTRQDFAEGLNKVAIEGVLAGRPVIVSKYIPATDILGDAVIVADKIEAKYLADLIASLYEKSEVYFNATSSTQAIQDVFFDPKNSWKTALKKAVNSIDNRP
ncbi:MAG: glycosyltransferase family 4 protein [Nitrincola lacisaponensis]|uniref:glycosyltransferase family 4 protein n=1 Tax=Nitrincola lacisaponensis TaxID=267850 RepID=UPI00391D3D7D